MEISRDKKNPTWAYVWDGNKPKKFTDDDKRIIIDACEDGGVCVRCAYQDRYINDKRYSTSYYRYFQIIKEPEYRPFETIEEYIEATKDRKDLRAISKINNSIISVDEITIIPRDNTMLCRGKCSKDIFNNYVWLDDRSPVGVKK